MTDLELLQRYADTQASDAFQALVERQVDLVYSAARRQVRSHHLAEDVVQSVFLELARHARTVAARSGPLAPWLYVVTRRTAIDLIRRESRRQQRESTAAELAAMKTPSETWPQIESLIDEAMSDLPEPDRAALLLRFFKNQPLREVGAALGLSEDTAQKRVSRALERLRGLLAARGLGVASTVLAADLSAAAVQPAPALLAATVGAQVASAPVAALTAAAQHTLMTTLQKTTVAAVVALSLGLATYEAVVALPLRARVRAADTTLAALAAEARETQRELDAAERELARARGASAASDNPDVALTRAAATWLTRVAALRRSIDAHPEWKIPELRLLTDRDWLLAAMNASGTDATQDAAAARFLRDRARQAWMRDLGDATNAYLTATGRLPTHGEDLRRFLDPRSAPEILARYDATTACGVFIVAEQPSGIPGERTAIFTRYRDGKSTNGGSSFENETERTVRQAAVAYAQSHGGTPAPRAVELRPYLTLALSPAEAEAAFRKLPPPLQ